jgi:hypothetical protein
MNLPSNAIKFTKTGGVALKPMNPAVAARALETLEARRK